MKKYFGILQESALFSGMSEQEIELILPCLSAAVREYAKGALILPSGERGHQIGMMLVGNAGIIREDFWGNRNLIAAISPGEVFAESYACLPEQKRNVAVTAETTAMVLWLDVRRILSPCSSCCPQHTGMIRNLLSVLAQKNLLLNEKMTHLTKRTTRQKLLSFLSAEAIRQGSANFRIPFNRQQLADYLSVDRSALSGELCRMRDYGLIAFHKNSFTLYEMEK